MKKLLIFSILALFFSLSHAQVNNVICSEQQTLFPIEEFSTKKEVLDIEADKSEIKVQDNYYFSGNAIIRSSDYFVAADNINMSKSNQSVQANGSVRFQDNTFQTISDYANAQKQGDNLIVLIKNAQYIHLESKANGSAENILKKIDGVEFEEATFTFCPIGNSDWLIKASSISIDNKTKIGIVKNAVIEFLGVPVFYIPIYVWTLKDQDSTSNSGFLNPNIDIYKDSISQKYAITTRIPYYFRLASDKDLLLALRQMSTRGSAIDGKYRQLIYTANGKQNGDLSIEWQYLFEDYITSQNRWLLKTKLDIDISDNSNLKIKTERVSDANYYRDIYGKAADDDTLISYIDLSFEGDYNNLKAGIYSESKQAINNAENEYTKSFEVYAEQEIGPESKTIETSIIATKFEHKDAIKTTGKRVHGEISTKIEHQIESGKITTNAFLSGSKYLIDNDNNKSRIIAGFGIDTIFPSNSQTTLFGNKLNTTFTPRIAYRFIPKIAQGSLPIFDTTDNFNSLLTYDKLFSFNRYSGIDRIANANDITIGFELNYLNPNSKSNILNINVAQSYYISDEVVSDTDAINYEKRKHFSDIATSFNLALKNLEFSSATQFNPSRTSIDNSKNSVSYKINPKRFISLSHENDNTNKTMELYGAYPVNDYIHIFGGLKKSTTTGITEKKTLGIAYESCCWAVRLANFKEDVNGVYDNNINIEFVFKGLGSTSSNMAQRLENNIPYYRSELTQ